MIYYLYRGVVNLKVAMSMLARGLYPVDDVLQQWTTVRQAREWSGTTAAEWTAVSTLLDAADIDEPLLVAATPPHLLTAALATWAQDGTPGTMVKVRMGLTLNALRLKFHMEPVDLLPPPPGAAAPAAPAPVAHTTTVVVAPPATVKVKLCQVIDQGLDQEVPLLTAPEIADMRKRYLATFGDPPLQRAEVTDAQLTALHFKTSQGLAPYADFGVWGPHGARLERRLRFTSHVMSPDGTWRTVELPGADSLDTWRDCWAVFKTAAIMDQVALIATLDRYESKFVERCRRYPDAWHLCAQADIRCRSEFFIDERRKQERFHTAHATLSAYDPLMPWNSVIKAAADDTEFWDRELKEPALLYTVGRGRSHPSHVEQQPEQAGSKRTRNGKRKNNGQTHTPPAQVQPTGSKGRGGKGKGSGKDNNVHPRRVPSGKYSTDRQGKQICFAWSRDSNGCTNGACPKGRSHVCEWCLQPHRTIDHRGGEGGRQDGKHM